MGCDSYCVVVPLSWSSDRPELPKSREESVMFAEDDAGCLCTFPDNDGERLTRDRLVSLAMLGAAVVLMHRGLLAAPEHQIGITALPGCLPAWLRKGIEAACIDPEAAP